MSDFFSDLFNFLSFIFSLIYSWVSWLWDLIIGLFTGDTWVLLWHGVVAAGETVVFMLVGFIPGVDQVWLAQHACEVNFFVPLDNFSVIVGIYIASLPLIVPGLAFARWIKISS